MKAKVAYITGREPEDRQKVVALAPKEFDVVVIEGRASEEEMVAKAIDCDFILAQAATIPARLLKQAPRLKLVQVSSQGFDRVPLDVVNARGIPVANNGGANAIAVSEHAVMLMLAVSRRLFGMADLLKGKRDQYREERARLSNLCHQLLGRTVGIIGMGNQGRHVSRILFGFGAHVIATSRHKIPQDVLDELKVSEVTFEELLRTSDIVSLHVPLDDSTRGFIGWEQLNMMKPSAFLINVSRGRVVDEEALIRALKEGKIAGAGLDVFTQEPPKADNPLLFMENVVATPHVASPSQEELESRFVAIWENIYRVWQGQPPRNVVNKV